MKTLFFILIIGLTLMAATPDTVRVKPTPKPKSTTHVVITLKEKAIAKKAEKSNSIDMMEFIEIAQKSKMTNDQKKLAFILKQKG